MAIGKSIYVPILKWRMGEYQALLRLEDRVKDSIVPLFIIPPIEYDFEEQRPKKTIDEHISPFGQRYRDKWGIRKSLIDVDGSLESQIMPSGRTVIQHIFDEIRMGNGCGIPVVKLTNEANHKKSIRGIAKLDGQGVAFRIELEELMDVDFNKKVAELLKEIGCEKDSVDLIVDLTVPSTFEPYDEFAEAIREVINSIEGLNTYRSFVLAGTALNLSEVKRPGTDLLRHEWHFYKSLCLLFGNEVRIPNFGDYTIESPGFTSLDMRKIRPAGKIVYTADDVWHIRKGGAFRDDNAQMQKHCRDIIRSNHYKGADYSQGDLRIENTANGKENYGNLTTWKWVGVNHHITVVVQQVSSFHGS